MKTSFFRVWVGLSLFLITSFTYSDNAAHADDSWTLAQARQEEYQCIHWPFYGRAERISCLEEVSDWWFHQGGNFVSYNPYKEMNRIMELQLSYDPTMVDTISSLAYYTFSVEVDDIQQGATDFTLAPLEAYLKRESVNKDNYSFYLEGCRTHALIFNHPQYGTLETKKIYYRQTKRFLAEAQRLWAFVDKSRIDAHTVTYAETTFRVAAKILAKHPELDCQASDCK